MPKRPTLPNTPPRRTGNGDTASTNRTPGAPAKAAPAKPKPSATRGSSTASPLAAKTKPATRTVAPTLSAPSGTGRWLRGIHFSAFSLVMMGILVLAVVILAPTLQALVQQRQQIADQQAVVDKLTSQVDAAKAQRARWNDPSYIRAQARDRLYYVMPGETSYLVIDDRPPAAVQTDDPVSSKLQKTRTDWVGSLFGSFMGAGLTEATPQQLTGQTGTPTPESTPSK
ncbi:FtsB family cell division protein [Leifsonia sp. ZF2019]|uniref:FtsB family cell division protein n=1 Tax=Leifsonia sp. ZF2019 TaxID=2781978 RepID=UPI001CBC8CE2|nr:septum formation initiator family protein [Leifsonia sp. ZF2019]